jgi:DNA polymerase-3 subunit epsilon
LIGENSFENQNRILLDGGRSINERSAILIENGIYKGYAYYDLNYQVTHIDILKNILIPMQHNRDAKTIIQGQIRKSKTLKIISF